MVHKAGGKGGMCKTVLMNKLCMLALWTLTREVTDVLWALQRLTGLDEWVGYHRWAH